MKEGKCQRMQSQIQAEDGRGLLQNYKRKSIFRGPTGIKDNRPCQKRIGRTIQVLAKVRGTLRDKGS